MQVNLFTSCGLVAVVGLASFVVQDINRTLTSESLPHGASEKAADQLRPLSESLKDIVQRLTSMVSDRTESAHSEAKYLRT